MNPTGTPDVSTPPEPQNPNMISVNLELRSAVTVQLDRAEYLAKQDAGELGQWLREQLADDMASIRANAKRDGRCVVISRHGTNWI